MRGLRSGSRQVGRGVETRARIRCTQHRLLHVAQRLRQRRPGQQLLVAGEEGDRASRFAAIGVVFRLRQRRGQVEREQPRAIRRLQRDHVRDRGLAAGSGDAAILRAARGPPAAVETRQHRAAPIAFARRRRRPFEVDAKRDVIRQRQLADLPRLHRVGQSRLRRVVRRQSPERRGKPWEKHEQQNRDRQPLQDHDAAAPHGGRATPRRRAFFRAIGQRIERRADQHHGRQHGQRRQQRLPVEKWRDQQEAGQAYEQRAIPIRAGLQELDGDEYVQERDGRVAARQVSVRRAHGERSRHREQHERPRGNARRRRQRSLAIPAQYQQAQDDQQHAGRGRPDGQVRRLRQLRQQQQRAEPAYLRGRQQLLFLPVRARRAPTEAKGVRKAHARSSRGNNASAVSAL